jgi:2-polyprenyl-6-methoxyphenol hydroxylase-like FAD-dependent oxidoreductase
VTGTRTWQTGWVVGADGAGSTVRKSAGIDFRGTDTDTWAYLGDVRSDAPPPPGFGVQNEKGALIVAPLPGGRPAPVAEGNRAAALVLENVAPNAMAIQAADPAEALKHSLVPGRGTAALPS